MGNKVNKLMKSILRGPIYLYGPSGVGKTTIANKIADWFNLPVITNSYLEHTGKKNHHDALKAVSEQDKGDMVMGEYSFLNIRWKAFEKASIENDHKFISDRSLMDNLAYFVVKGASRLPPCEIDVFKDAINNASSRIHNSSGYLIYIPYGKTQIDNGWKFARNGKRIVSEYFQAMVSGVMTSMLDFFDSYRKPSFIYTLLGMRGKVRYIKNGKLNDMPVLIIDTSRNNGNNIKRIKRQIYTFILIESFNNWLRS